MRIAEKRPRKKEPFEIVKECDLCTGSILLASTIAKLVTTIFTSLCPNYYTVPYPYKVPIKPPFVHFMLAL